MPAIEEELLVGFAVAAVKIPQEPGSTAECGEGNLGFRTTNSSLIAAIQS